MLDQLAQDLPGDPASFTQLVIYPDYAVASALDGRTVVGRLWRQGSVREWPGTPVDDAGAAFTRADVRPSAIATAVVAAPSALADPAAVASYVIVERSHTDPLRPLQISVYVDGGQHYVSGDAEGTVLATH